MSRSDLKKLFRLCICTRYEQLASVQSACPGSDMKCDKPRPRNRTVLEPQLLHNLQAKSQQRLHDSESPVAGFQLRLAYLADAQPLSKCHLQNLDIQAKISPQTQFQKQPACCSRSGAKATALSACPAAGGAPPLTRTGSAFSCGLRPLHQLTMAALSVSAGSLSRSITAFGCGLAKTALSCVSV